MINEENDKILYHFYTNYCCYFNKNKMKINFEKMKPVKTKYHKQQKILRKNNEINKSVFLLKL